MNTTKLTQLNRSLELFQRVQDFCRTRTNVFQATTLMSILTEQLEQAVCELKNLAQTQVLTTATLHRTIEQAALVLNRMDTVIQNAYGWNEDLLRTWSAIQTSRPTTAPL
ncbi:MAG: hypothetical protein K1Y36_18460 [Blastocatellia bacterium]|nr:hypothetical protein [Blastocatellia bacterium]